MVESRHVSVHIERSPDDVYTYARDPANLPLWASGLADGTVERIDGAWVADSPMGRVRIEFAPPNDYGVLDHEVATPDGHTFHNPMRVVREGEGSEVVFTVRPVPDADDADLERDAETVLADLQRLRALLEA